MTFTGKLNEDELNDSRRLAWQPQYRLNWFNNLMFHRVGFVWMMAAIFVLTMAWTALWPAHRMKAVLVEGVLCVGVVAGMRWKARYSDKGLLVRLQQDLPQRIQMNEEAVVVLREDGRSFASPWEVVEEWRVTRSVAMLIWKDGGVVMIGLEGNAEVREQLLTMMRKKLGSPTYEL